MNTINHNTLKAILFESFSKETFLQWYYDNEQLLESNHAEFFESISAYWELSSLPDLESIKDLIKYKLIGQTLFEFWEMEFYLKEILKAENSVSYGRKLYSEYYEDKNNAFLNSISDLIVLYCYNKESLGLPPLDSPERQKVNRDKLYPKIMSECKIILPFFDNYPKNQGDPFWTQQKSFNDLKDDFQQTLDWYKNELKEVDKIG